MHCWRAFGFESSADTEAAAATTAEVAAAEETGLHHVGSPTECALLELALELGFNPELIRKQQLMVYGDVSRGPFLFVLTKVCPR